MSTGPKNLKEHCQYLCDISRLKLWFLFDWLGKHPDETFQSVLRNRIDLYRKTDFNHGGLCADTAYEMPEWLKFESRVESIYSHHKAKNDGDGFENEAYSLLEDHIRNRAPLDFRNEVARRHLKEYQCGSLRYDKPREEAPRTVFVHIANAIAPESIFADPAYLPDCFRQLMKAAEKEHDADCLTTDTWLNSHPRWLELFPEVWKTNLKPENHDVLWHYGYWGQFITARGTLNAKAAGQLRATGEMPYWPRTSHCSFADLRKHVGT